MTLEELNKEQKHLYNRYMDERYKLYLRYALEHNPYKIGDIVQDHIGKVKVESIGYYISYNDIPMCLYKGTELKVDGTPKKRKVQRYVYQQNLKK